MCFCARSRVCVRERERERNWFYLFSPEVGRTSYQFGGRKTKQTNNNNNKTGRQNSKQRTAAWPVMDEDPPSLPIMPRQPRANLLVPVIGGLSRAPPLEMAERKCQLLLQCSEELIAKFIPALRKGVARRTVTESIRSTLPSVVRAEVILACWQTCSTRFCLILFLSILFLSGVSC